MASPDYPFEAVRVIDIVTYADGRSPDDDPVEIHRVRVYNPGDLVPPSAVLGNAEAGPNAWLKLGPDVRYRPGREPKPAPKAEPKGK
jgi:hypothetical protein